MNEAALANSNMYDEVMEINQLNKVEGFDPCKYMRLIEGDTYYLDVVFRKLWFRLKYPQGKIVKKILKIVREIHPYEEPCIDIVPLLSEEDF